MACPWWWVRMTHWRMVYMGAGNGLLRKMGNRGDLEVRGFFLKGGVLLQELGGGLWREMNINGGGFSMVEAITDRARRVSWVWKREPTREREKHKGIVLKEGDTSIIPASRGLFCVYCILLCFLASMRCYPGIWRWAGDTLTYSF